MQRTRIALLRGGSEDGFSVSLKTGASLLKSIDPADYEVVDVVITKAGEWLVRGQVRDPRSVLNQVDMVLIGLQGKSGEDGKVQRLIDTLGIPYTGSRAFPSLLTSNKAMTKDALKEHGVRTPDHMVVGRDVVPNLVGAVASIMALFGPMYVVKPISGGLSVGTMYADNALMLEQALRTSLSVYEQVLVEKFIEGPEATCGVIEKFRDQDLYALPVVEIQRDSPIFTHEEKYVNRKEHVCPGCLKLEEKKEIERLAKLAHTKLGLSHYSRADFIVGKDGIYFLETNSHPDIAVDSLFAQALEVVGSTHAEFIAHLLTLARGYKRGI